MKKNKQNHTWLCCSRWILRVQVSQMRTALRLLSTEVLVQSLRTAAASWLQFHTAPLSVQSPESLLEDQRRALSHSRAPVHLTVTFLYFHHRGRQFPDLGVCPLLSFSQHERKRENLHPASLKINLPRRARLQTWALYISSTWPRFLSNSSSSSSPSLSATVLVRTACKHCINILYTCKNTLQPSTCEHKYPGTRVTQTNGHWFHVENISIEQTRTWVVDLHDKSSQPCFFFFFPK